MAGLGHNQAMASPRTQIRLSDTMTKRDLPPANEQLQQLLLKLWANSKATIAERLETIRHAQTQMAKNSLSSATRTEAVDAAHKLAGILGTFGLPQGTELARQIEEGLNVTKPAEGLSAEGLDELVKQLGVLIDKKSEGI
jgi:HPt (histidine-containing phosphotransfer) domain-containing protein